MQMQAGSSWGYFYDSR